MSPMTSMNPLFVDEYIECTRPIDGNIDFNNTGGTLLVRGKAGDIGRFSLQSLYRILRTPDCPGYR